MFRIFIFLLISFIMPFISLTGFAEAKEFRIDVYSAGKAKKNETPDLSKLTFIRSIHVSSISNQYFIYASSEEERSPQIPPLENPSLRREPLKSSSATFQFRKKKPQTLLSRNAHKTPPPRRVIITETDRQLFSVTTIWPMGRTSRSKTSSNPFMMFEVLLELENYSGRRDISYREKQGQWRVKSDDARVIPGLSRALSYTREHWDSAFNDGILGVDENWSIYALVMSSERNIRWTGTMASYQVVIGFQLVNHRSGTNLFIQISNWTNDSQHRSYDYCNPATSADSPLLSEPETQVDGAEPWTPHPIFVAAGIYPPAEDTADSLRLGIFNEGFEYGNNPSSPSKDIAGFMLLTAFDEDFEDSSEGSVEDTENSTPPAYCKGGFEDVHTGRDDDEPMPPGAAGCSGCQIWSDR